MTLTEALDVIRKLEIVPPDSTALIGFEPACNPLDFQQPEAAVTLAGMILDAHAAGRPVLAVNVRCHIQIWEKSDSHDFWRN